MVARKKKVSEHVLLECGIGRDYHKLRLADYRGPQLYKRRIEKYVEHIDQMRKEGLSFLFWGSNNTGKTTLAAIICKAYLINGYSPYITNLRDMTDTYCSAWYDRSQIVEFDTRVKNCDFLVIDDLNKEFQNRMTGVVLDEVLRHRSNMLLPFAITTNASPTQLNEEYGSSFSALLERRCVSLEFAKRAKNSESLVTKNLDILDSLTV